MATSVWRGSLSFALLTIPIRLYTAARSDRVYLHQLHKACNSRLKQPLFCPLCNRQVERSEVIRGYEYEEGQYLLVEGDEIEKIMPRSRNTMEIVAFAKQEQIDAIYFDASYFVLPEKDGEKAHALLLKTLEDTDRVGVAKLNMHQREYTAFIRPRNHGLTVHTMYFGNEIREVRGYGEVDKSIRLKPQEIKLAEQLVERLSMDFQPEQYRDTFQKRLRALIAVKKEGKTMVPEHKPSRAPVIDMMEALKGSLRNTEAQKAKKPARQRPAGTERENHRRLAS
jgi:DNA end-binding protein Ku